MTKPFQLIGLGELLWDCFPDRRLPGGAPANVAFHAQQLGLTTAVATRVGEDDLGHEICQYLLSQGLNTELVQHDPKHGTGTVTVTTTPEGKTDYVFLQDSAWDFLDVEPTLIEAIRTVDAICFGTLAQRGRVTRSTIHKCLQSASDRCVIVYDVNLRPPYFDRDWIMRSLDAATIVKLNNEEVKILARMLDFPDDEIRFAKYLLDRHRRLELVCVTRGGNGCLAVSCQEIIELTGIPIKVVDTVGAGDAFTAAVIFGRVEKWPLARTIDLANAFGALVASRPGAMPVLREELASLKSELDWSFRPTPSPS